MALSPQGTDKQGNYWWAENSSKNYVSSMKEIIKDLYQDGPYTLLNSYESLK